ncbi:MAG: class I SAM-dependent methyltransferase, partial [Legionellales bacterium]|nr:class I SAM-dependent methyltransferase [Legionellales bacterium]
HANIEYVVMRAEEMNLNQQFDMAISFFCLHWIKNQEIVLKKIYNLLKPGGKTLFAIVPRPKLLWESLDNVINKNQWKSYFIDFDPGYHYYDDTNYPQLAKAAGFSIEKIECVSEKLYGIDSKPKFESLLSGWLPHLHVLPNSLHQCFLNEVSSVFMDLMRKNHIYKFADHERLLLKVHLMKPKHVA